MNDTELMNAWSAARKLAHDAPLKSLHTENKNGKPTGHHWVEGTDTWAIRSRVWADLDRERAARGIPFPSTGS